MKITIEDYELKELLRKSFDRGCRWAETYQTWFIPKKRQTTAEFSAFWRNIKKLYIKEEA